MISNAYNERGRGGSAREGSLSFQNMRNLNHGDGSASLSEHTSKIISGSQAHLKTDGFLYEPLLLALEDST